MKWTDILGNIIAGLQPEHVPLQYIIMAKLTDHQGVERAIRGAELAHFMADPDKANVREARVVLDVRKIRKTMIAEITSFFDKLDALIASR